MNKDQKKTPLYSEHVSLGARMVPFAGYSMPVQYAGIIEEHENVRRAAGIFDVSHMGEIEVRGNGALAFCQKVSTNDASVLTPGAIQYTTLCNPKGGIIDDCTLYCISPEHYLFVVNASRKDVVLEWFLSNPVTNAVVEDRSESFGLLALQGPKAEEILKGLTSFSLSEIAYYRFAQVNLSGKSVLLSRTGYTGEDGFELYINVSDVVSLWRKLLEVGAPLGLMPVGLGARDTLRLEMGYLLYGNDMTEEFTPLESGLGWVVKPDKGEFSGRAALVSQKAAGVKRTIRGLKCTGKGIPRAGCEVYSGSERVGVVTSGTFSPSLRTGIALARVSADLQLGDLVDVDVRGKRHSATLMKPPFVRGSVKK